MYAGGTSLTTTHTITSASGCRGISAQRRTLMTPAMAKTGTVEMTREHHGCSARNAVAVAIIAGTSALLGLSIDVVNEEGTASRAESTSASTTVREHAS